MASILRPFRTSDAASVYWPIHHPITHEGSLLPHFPRQYKYAAGQSTRVQPPCSYTSKVQCVEHLYCVYTHDDVLEIPMDLLLLLLLLQHNRSTTSRSPLRNPLNCIPRADFNYNTELFPPHVERRSRTKRPQDIGSPFMYTFMYISIP